MDGFYSKLDEIADLPLPNEMMAKIFSYLEHEWMNISMVTKRWFAIVNDQIEEILIKLPTQENLDEVRNLVNRYPRLKNLAYDRYEEEVLTNLIEKEEGKPPKIVAPDSIIT